MTACDAQNVFDETSFDASTDNTTTIATEQPEAGDIYTFTATVLDSWDKMLLVETNDEKMLLSADRYFVSLPENISHKNFADGDVVELTIRYIIPETYPAQLPDVISVRRIVES